MAEGVIPRKDVEKITWAENMERNFPSIGASLGFSAAEIAGVLADTAMLKFVILNALKAKAHSKAANAYKKMILNKRKPNAVLSAPPEFTAVALPAEITLSGVIKRLQKAAARMKLSPNYTNAVGELLRIIPTKPAPLSLNEAKAKAEAFSIANSVTRIDWVKGRFDGVFIESQRGDEKDWTRLGFDTRSPFIDARPPLEAGKPEERRYRLRYFFNDEEVGNWSNVIVIITKP